MCKQENQQIITDSIENAKEDFEDYPLWGNELGSDFFFREDVGIFFPSSYYEAEILPLFGYHCGVCQKFDGITDTSDTVEEESGKNKSNRSRRKKKKSPLKSLQDHLRVEHRLALCQLCVEFKRDFVSRLPRLYPTQLKTHLTKGDGEGSGFKGHPLCEFCRPKRFYDLTQLHMHLQREHYKCHVCDKQGLANQYFRNYDSLEKHFDKRHFLCKDPQCLAARFMVFENEIDLRAHELSVHGGTSSGSTKIQLEFRIRREGYGGEGYEDQTIPSEDDFQYGLDGQAFVPEALPNANGPNQETSDPLHFRRTEEMRAQAAEMRAAAEEGSKEEAFPTLREGRGENNMLRMGWTSNNRITRKKPSLAEEFPTLPSNSTTRKTKGATSKLRATQNRQFSAMQSAASMPSTSNWNAGNQAIGAPTPTRARMNSFNTNTPALKVNRQSDLASSNFPGLGRASKTRASYPSVASMPPRASSKKVNLSSPNFPALGGASKSRSTVSSFMNRKPPPHAGADNFLSISSHAANTSKSKVASFPVNRKADLSVQSFPALGNSSKTRPTYPINNIVKKKLPPPATTSNNFSALSNSNTTTKGQKMTAKKKSQQNKTPPMTNAQHFPPPPTASAKNTSVRNKLLKKDSEMVVSSLQEGISTVDDIKASLGAPKYKELKKLTKEFAVDALAPQEYVEKAAVLFDGDEDFWGFVPGLLMSCPNENSAGEALRYMEELKVAQMTSTLAATTTSTTWSSSPAAVASIRGQQQLSGQGPGMRNGGKGGAAWNGKKSKQQKTKGDTKKKGKQKNDLRALAFGS